MNNIKLNFQAMDNATQNREERVENANYNGSNPSDPSNTHKSALVPNNTDDDNEQKNDQNSNVFPFTIDHQDKFASYNAFLKESQTLTNECVFINQLINDANLKLVTIKRRKLILANKCNALGYV